LGSAMDASLAITAGAIVSGAFFGDKMSPLSDTTNLASTIVKVDLFDHIKHMSLTTIQAFLVSFILFALLSPNEAISVENLESYMTSLEGTELMYWTSWIPLIILVLATLLRIPAFISLAVSSVIATLLARITSGLSWSDIWGI